MAVIKEVKTMTRDQISNLPPEYFNMEGVIELQAIEPNQMAWLTYKQFCAMRPERFRLFTPEQIVGLLPEQVQWILSDLVLNFTLDHLGHLTAEQRAVFSEEDNERAFRRFRIAADKFVGK